MSYVLGNFILYFGVTDAVMGAWLGFFLWLGFIAPVTLGDILWVGRPVKLFFLNNSYWLLTLCVISALLAVRH